MEEQKCKELMWQVNTQLLKEVMLERRDAILRLLLFLDEGNIKDTSSAVLWACKREDVEVLKILIELGVDVTVKDNLPIMVAANRGNVEMVKLLIEAGTDVTTSRNYPIRLASQQGYKEVVELLIEAGADVTADYNYALKMATKK